MRPSILNDPGYTELMNFLIEKTEDAKSSMSIMQLAKDFKENSGSSQQVNCLIRRIGFFRSKIRRMDSVDTAAKVKMLVALGAPIDMDFLNELRMNAHVEVDGNNRITKYKAKDGSLEMEGDHSQSAKRKSGWDRQKQIMNGSLNDSDDGSQHLTPKTRGSVKRTAAEVSCSSKRARDSSPTRFMKLEDYVPDDSVGSPVSSGSGAKEPFSPTSPNPEIPLPRKSELEGAPGASGSPETSGARPRQETPIFRSRGAPKASGASLRPKSRANRASNGSGAAKNTKSGANDAQTPQIKFLAAIQFLISPLDIPSLSQLQTKIEQKLRESSNERIPNNEMVPTMELLVAKIANHSMTNPTENVESVSFIQLLCYLKAAILNSKLEGLENLLEKIKESIKEPDSKNKIIPAEKVTSVLQDTLNNVGF